MGRRGPPSRLTDDMIERVKEQYRNGIAHRKIAAEVGTSETNIRRIISIHGVPNRGRKMATLLSADEEDALVRYLSTIEPFRGKFRTLRTFMEQVTRDHGMKFTFTYSWRDGFVRRHGHRLPPHIIKLLSPKVQRDEDIDSDLDILDDNFGLPEDESTKEPSVWKQKPKLSVLERAMKETKKAFARAGLTKEETDDLLIKLKVPGCKNELPPSQIPSFSSYTDLMELDPSTISFLPDSSDIAAETAAEAAAAAKVARKKERKAPTKKTPMQLDILEKAFIKSPTCGDKRAKKIGRLLGLTPFQVLCWFHNNARRKRKQNQSIVLAEHFANEGLEILEGLPDLPEDEEGTGMDSTDGNPMDGLSLEGTEVDNEEGEGEPIVEGEEYEEHTEEMEGMDQDVGETEETEATEGETEYSSGLPGEV